MTNSIRRFPTVFLIIAGTLSWHATFSQTGSISPYSRYGIGDIYLEGFTRQTSMGGLGAAITSPFHINFLNPASYVADSAIVFEFGARGEVNQLKKEGTSTTLNSASFSYLSLAFPVVKGRMSAAFGLLPYSSVGYNILVNTYNVPDIGTIRYKYEGAGGYNKFFLGTGVKISKNLSAGVNASYLFGTIENIKSVEFPAGSYYFNSRYVNAVTAKGFHFNYGILYHKTLKNNLVLSGGIAGSLSTRVRAYNNRYYFNYSISAFGGEIIKDSIYNEKETKGHITMPMNWRGGLSLGKPDKWQAGFDVVYTHWEEYKNFNSTDTLKNSYSIHVGGEKSTSRFDFRLGARYGTTYLNFNNTQLDDYGITFGLGIKKLFPKRPPSSINIGVEVGQRGTLENNLIKEQYIRFHLGFSLADIWFIQPKYD